MTGWDSARAMRRELLFDDRVVSCFAQRPSTLYAMFREAEAVSPDGEALIYGNIRLDWRSLLRAVEEVAAGLRIRGVTHGDRVALLIGNRPEFVIALLATSRLGAVAVPISVREEAPGVAYALCHSGAKILLFDPVHSRRLPSRDEVPGVHAWLETGDANDPWRDLRCADALPEIRVRETDNAAILYTSGTTGKPKGAVITHVNIVHAAMIYEEVMSLGSGERSLVAVPMTHVTGLTGMIASMIRCAGTLIIMSEFKAEAFVQLASDERITHTVLVPAMYNLILARADLSSVDLSSWRIGGYGGALMPAPTITALAEALPTLGLMNLYGATETTCALLAMPSENGLIRREQVGLPVPGTEVLIMNDDGTECASGEMGEIWLRGSTVFPSYWNDPDATAEALCAGFWRSGDLGARDTEGYVAVLDRKKDMIVRGGFKIYSAEVESVLAEHPSVLESAVVSRPCAVLGERVHAFVTLRDTGLSADELVAFCAKRLADYKRPETYTIGHDPLPRNGNGKLLKRNLRDALFVQTQPIVGAK